MPNHDLIVLELHRENVAKAHSFEEFKRAQLSLLDYMIEKMGGTDEDRSDEANLSWAAVCVNSYIDREEKAQADAS